jgi:poly(3-hydroxybutyrate) depolymerase
MTTSVFAMALAQLTPIQFNFTGILDEFAYLGVPRQYKVLFPTVEIAPKAARVPAILMLHGNTADADTLALQTNMTQFAPARGFFLVMPDGVQTPGSKHRTMDRSWNSGACCDEAYTHNVDDVAFLSAVIDDLLHRFPHIDPGAVFMTGTSLGGSMALRAACSIPEKLAGVASDVGSFEAYNGMSCASACEANEADGYTYCVWNQSAHAGCTRDAYARRLPEHRLPQTYSCDAQRHKPVPTLLANGWLDPVSNVSGGITYPTIANTSGSYNTSFPPTDFVTSFLLETWGCDPHAESVISFHNGTLRNYTSCRTWPSCATNVTLCLSDAGHKWFGDHPDIYAVCRFQGRSDDECNIDQILADFGPDTDSMRLTNEMLDFFERHLPWTMGRSG